MAILSIAPNAQSRAMEEIGWCAWGIPYIRCVGGGCASTTGEIKECLAYWPDLVNPADRSACCGCLKCCRGGIGKTTVQRLTDGSPSWSAALGVVSDRRPCVPWQAAPQGLFCS